MPENTAPAPGTIVSAPRWERGTELAPERGIVLSPVWDSAREYSLIYFPGTGSRAVAPVPGTTVQPILRCKITDQAAPHTTSAKFISASYNAMRHARRIGQWLAVWNPGGYVIENEHQARLAARRARKVTAA